MTKPKPAPLRERDITRQIAREYYKEFDQLIESDVIIVGAGPSGLICAHDLADMGFRTLIVEQSLALGGGFWHGGYLMNKPRSVLPHIKSSRKSACRARKSKTAKACISSIRRTPRAR
jgi:sulfide-dependent adenosine diphosphate thiazole synthase